MYNHELANIQCGVIHAGHDINPTYSLHQGVSSFSLLRPAAGFFEVWRYYVLASQ